MYKKITKKQATDMYNNGYVVTVADNNSENKTTVSENIYKLINIDFNTRLEELKSVFPNTKRFIFFATELSFDKYTADKQAEEEKKKFFKLHKK